MKKFLQKAIGIMFMVLLAFPVVLSGCAGTIKAIENREMTTKVKMSDSIILDAQNLAKNKTVYIRVTNTSDMQEIVFEDALRNRISQKGYIIINDPSSAGYIIQANVLYMDYAKESMTADAAAVGGFGGALLGSGIGGGFKENVGGALVGGVIGSVAGAVVGKMVRVDNYIGVIDVQIQERVADRISGTMKTDARQGSATSFTTDRKIETNYQTYRTRMAAEAVQTNINKDEAARVISNKIASQISGVF